MSPRNLVIALTVVVSACAQRDERDAILGTLERDRIELIAESDEPIVEISVREGDVVAPGAVLLRQDLGAMQARLDQARAGRRVAERRYAGLVEGPRAQEIIEARAALESARSALATEINEHRRIEDLVARKLFSQSALDQARARRDAAAGARKQASARLNLLLEGTRTEEIDQAAAALEQADAALAELELSARRYTIAAPRAGRIEAIPYKRGERPAPGAPLIVMLADGAPYARVHIGETRRVQFGPGVRVRVHIDGRDPSYGGVVRFISAQAAFTPYYALTQEDRSRLSYLAEIDVENAADLPTGVPVQVTLAEKSE